MLLVLGASRLAKTCGRAAELAVRLLRPTKRWQRSREQTSQAARTSGSRLHRAPGDQWRSRYVPAVDGWLYGGIWQGNMLSGIAYDQSWGFLNQRSLFYAEVSNICCFFIWDKKQSFLASQHCKMHSMHKCPSANWHMIKMFSSLFNGRGVTGTIHTINHFFRAGIPCCHENGRNEPSQSMGKRSGGRPVSRQAQSQGRLVANV